MGAEGHSRRSLNECLRRSLSTTLCHAVWLSEPPEDGAGVGKGSSMDARRDDAWMCEGTMVLHGHPVCRVLKTLQQAGYCSPILND
jgi:hypothetical protein